MSIGVCRVEKYKTAHDIAGIQIHDRRERDHSNSNPDIDFSKSRDNYSLCDNTVGISFNEYIDKQIKARYTGKKAIRKDAVRMFQVLCTSDKEFFDRSEDNGRTYFEACLRWACERWGAQNIVSAVVHLDESVPHLHINIVPLTEDGRLSAKACVGDGSKALQRLQDDFFRECSSSFELERGNRAKLDEGEKPRKHQRMGEYKRNRATIQAQEATIREQAEILHAESENAPQGVPVPSMAKLLIGKENKDKLLYNADDVAAVQQLAKAAAVTAASNEREQSELADRADEVIRKEKELAETIEAATLDRRKAANELESANQKAEDIVDSAEDKARKIIDEAEKKAETREKAVIEREQSCEQREQRDQEWEQDLSDKEQLLDIRDTEPDRYYKAVIDDNESTIFNQSVLITGLEIDIKNVKKDKERAEQENAQLEQELRENAEKAKKAEEKIKNEYEMRLFNLNAKNQELAEQESKKDAQISELQKELAEAQEKLKKEENRANNNAKLYKAALEVGEYRDSDFAHKVQLCLENYRMSYIYGDRGYSR